MNNDTPAILGGPRSITTDPGDMFTWPIVTDEDEQAVLEVLRSGNMSGTDVTIKFEEEFAAWQGRRYGVAYNNGTSAILAAMFACGLGRGDELICPSVTYWASCLQAYSLGATVTFADIHPETLCIDPDAIEPLIGERTKAIMVVHYMGYPAEMDRIMEIARKHGLKVIEDVSHAQGAIYKGRKVGTFGDIAAMSLMSGKSFAAGEIGILLTDDTGLRDRGLAFGHYARFGKIVEDPELKRLAGLPVGGIKGRVHQLSSAMARVQLKEYDRRMAEIDKAMNYFWDGLEGLPGLRSHRPSREVPEGERCTKGGWYACRGIYESEELDGLSLTRFLQALKAEGVSLSPGANKPLHTHPLFTTTDIYGDGKPTRIASATRDVREFDKNLPESERIGRRTFSLPWFKHCRPEIIDEHVRAFRKVVAAHMDLLKDDPGDPPDLGMWFFYREPVDD